MTNKSEDLVFLAHVIALQQAFGFGRGLNWPRQTSGEKQSEDFHLGKSGNQQTEGGAVEQKAGLRTALALQ
jgi:hypothetical protein